MPNASRGRWLACNYAATIFLSAFLLFQVQPLVSKYILPWFGGSPAVWTTCMLFFQSLLFGGYAYAHFVSQRLAPRAQATLHLVVILTALAFLRVVPDTSWKPTDSSDPIGRILLLLSVSVGLPYFVLSTTGPLVQAWFARSYPGRTPYRLYALSNIGSLLALLTYPLMFERMFAAKEQASYWSWGFAAFAVLCGAAAIWLWKSEDRRKAGPESSPTEFPGSVEGVAVADAATPDKRVTVVDEAPTPARRVLWLALPAAASITLLATTNHLCTDVAVMPFLWVAPLSLYLLTFIVAFDHPRWYRRGVIAPLVMLAIYGAAMGIGTTDLYKYGWLGQTIHWVHSGGAAVFGGGGDPAKETLEVSIELPAYLAIASAAMFGIALLCHGELFRLRPDPKHLTSFYLMISAGGALGGVLVTLVAPHIFKTYFEWDLTIYLGFLAALGLWVRELLRTQRYRFLAAPVLLIGAVSIADLFAFQDYSSEGVLTRTRNFFGTLLVRDVDPGTADERMILKHGAITHGIQYVEPKRRGEPPSYYTEFSGVGRAMNFYHGREQAPALATDSEANTEANGALIEKMQQQEDGGRLSVVGEGGANAVGKKPVRIGVVGLGAGSLASYAAPGDFISFYEINDQVIEIAKNGKWFTFLPDCEARGAKYDLRPGDARLTLEHELKAGQPQHYDVLVLDAFSGDAIPAHLLTEQAFAIYMQHLGSTESSGRDGAIAIHITNHYVDLEPVVRALAEKFGLKTARVETPAITGKGVFHSDWMVLTKNEGLIAALAPFARPDPTPQGKRKPAILWTDDKNNLFDVLK